MTSTQTAHPPVLPVLPADLAAGLRRLKLLPQPTSVPRSACDPCRRRGQARSRIDRRQPIDDPDRSVQ